mgnify:CR=1 FL=1
MVRTKEFLQLLMCTIHSYTNKMYNAGFKAQLIEVKGGLKKMFKLFGTGLPCKS